MSSSMPTADEQELIYKALAQLGQARIAAEVSANAKAIRAMVSGDLFGAAQAYWQGAQDVVEIDEIWADITVNGIDALKKKKKKKSGGSSGGGGGQAGKDGDPYSELNVTLSGMSSSQLDEMISGVMSNYGRSKKFEGAEWEIGEEEDLLSFTDEEVTQVVNRTTRQKNSSSTTKNKSLPSAIRMVY